MGYIYAMQIICRRNVANDIKTKHACSRKPHYGWLGVTILPVATLLWKSNKSQLGKISQ